MPELPEVETIVRYLQKHIRGKRILEFTPLRKNNRLFRYHREPDEIGKIVVGRKIKDINRQGKTVLIELEDGKCLALHLMMTGKIFINPQEPQRPHDRLRMRLSGKADFVFNDIRKFGWCRLLSAGDQTKVADALEISLQNFSAKIKGRRTPVKSILLDQKVVSGIGNIYADEILWYAKINPSRYARSLTETEIGKIFSQMRRVLRLAIQKGGTSSRNYQRPDGSSGGYYEIRKAYQRTGEKCQRCFEGIIKRVIIGQRSSHFCPVCQPS